MDATLLQAVLKMSFTGSIVILTVLIARAILFKAPKIFSYMLWSVVLFRLLCPVSFFTHISVLQFTGTPYKIAEKNVNTKKHPQNTINIQKTVPQIKIANRNNIMPENTVPETAINIFLYCGTIIWLTGIIVITLHNAVPLFCLRRRLLAAVPLNRQVFLSDYITSPFVYGILHPRIYLPSSLSASEQEYIILHEQIHIRRKDYIIKLLAFAALAIHWFNPLVWLAFHLSEKDMEMSCDEAVMKKTGGDIRAEYSISLLKLASGRKNLIKTFAAFGENETGSRIRHIMKYKKPTIAITIMAIIVLIAIFVFAAGNPLQERPDAPADKIVNNKEPEETTKPEEWWQTWEDGNYIHIMDCAFVRGMTENTLITDPLEYISYNNTKRIKELGLDMEYDLLPGYYFNNPDKTTAAWKIDENTEFMFLDWEDKFKNDKNIIGTYSQHPYNVKLTYTKDKEVFRKYLATYKNSQPEMPFFFEVKNGVIKRIMEKYFI